MGKRSERRKHIPQRTCVACRAVRPKRGLIRIVRTPEGDIMVDETGKRSGRGAYLCPKRECWESALANRQLERSLRTSLTAETEAHLREYAAELSRSPTTSRLASFRKGKKASESNIASKGAAEDE